ncbi:MAG TPA: hypothetical protein VGI63_01555 [Verrucomicrobiae bacterium]|jgi:hypothetical protein
MNEKEQNFDQLKRLLKLKQHEVPPPGYFNNFSGNVISRIRAGESGGRQGFAERLETEAPWLLNFIRVFETRPGMIGGFATSLCLLLILGVVFAEYSDRDSKKMLELAAEPAAQPGNAMASLTPAVASPLLASSDSVGIVASTNPVTSLQPVTTLFGQSAPASLFQTASFAPAR